MKKILYAALLCLILFSCKKVEILKYNPGRFDFSNAGKFDEFSLDYQMGEAFFIQDSLQRYEKIKKILEDGGNPNRKTGEFDWIDTNPLWSCGCDYEVAALLISYGADVKKRPYIANLFTKHIIAQTNPRKEYIKYYEHRSNTVNTNFILEKDLFKTAEIFLKAGADVNLKTCHPPVILFPPTDRNYKRYFKQNGDSAINFCITENLLTLFPLLVDNGAFLDRKSLDLAEMTTRRTGSDTMEKLVRKIWQQQNE